MFRNYSRQFWLLSSSSFLFFGSFTMIVPELPNYLRGLGGEEYLGLIIALFTVTAGISRPFSGKLTDHWGRVPVMVVGACVSAIASLMYPLLASVPGFLAIRLFHGFSTGFKPTGTSAYIADIVPANKRGEALGISSFFGSVGMAAGQGLGPYVYQAWGINSLFYVSSAFAIASVAILVGIKETLPNRSKLNASMFKVTRSDIYEPTVLAPSIVMLLSTFSFGATITLAPDFSDYLGISSRGHFYITFTLASLMVRILGGKMSDKFGRVAVLKWSTVIIFISMVTIGLSSTPIQFFIGAILFGFGYGLTTPSLFAWTIDKSPERNKGRGVSTIFLFLEIGIGVGAVISGTVYQSDPGRFPIIFSVAGVFSLMAFLYLVMKVRK